MTLAAHGVVGAALGKNVKANLLAVFVLAFVSHWILDAIPHLDYQLGSYVRDYGNRLNDDLVFGAQFARDLILIGGDILLGLIVSWFLFKKKGTKSALLAPAVLVGYGAAIFPDILHFVQMKLKVEPFNTIQRVHDFFHSSIQFRSGFWFANATELIPIIILILLINYLCCRGSNHSS
ncbi:MAG: hypothetical protein WCO03_00915 [bacterium]